MTKALIRGSLFFFAFRFLAFAATLSAADQPAPAPPENSSPLVVLTRENVIEDEQKQQTGLARLSRNSRKEMAVGSGHFIQIERPDLVIGAIKVL